MQILVLFFYIFLILLGISFAALNATSVAVNFYFVTLNLPISVLAVVMLGVGIIIGFLLFLMKYWRIKILNSKLKNQLKLTEREIKNLRTIPIRNEDNSF